MLVARKSILDGNVSVMDLDITKEQLDRYNNGEGHIQTIFSNLPPEEREFIQSGITPEEWTKMFGDNDE